MFSAVIGRYDVREAESYIQPSSPVSMLLLYNLNVIMSMLKQHSVMQALCPIEGYIINIGKTRAKLELSTREFDK